MRIGDDKAFGPGPQTKIGQEIALADWSVGIGAAELRGPCQGCEIHMGRQIAAAWIGQHVCEAVTCYRLQSLAEARCVVAVIHDQGRAASGGDGGCDFLGISARRRCELSDTAVGASARSGGTLAGLTGIGARAKARVPFCTVTIRSHQPRPVFTNWRTGRQSKNSLATRNSGRSASVSSKTCEPGDIGGQCLQLLFLQA